MAIEIQQPGLAGLYGAAAVISKREVEARRKQEEQARKEEIRMQQEFQRSTKMLDAQLDLEMYERSKRWEIDKMELRSRLDFEREEKERVRKLDDIDNALRQIDKEVESGRMSEEQAQPLRFTYEMKKLGIDTPISLIRPPTEEKITPTKRTDIDAAIKFLREYEEKKRKAAKFYHPLAPEPTAEEEAAAEFYRGIIGDITPTAPPGIDEINIEPSSEAEFYSTVSKLKAIDPARARTYYDKWAGRF